MWFSIDVPEDPEVPYPDIDPRVVLAVLPEPLGIYGNKTVIQWPREQPESLYWHPRSFLVESRTEATIYVIEQLCREHGWLMSNLEDPALWDPWSIAQSPLAEAFEWGLFPYRDIGEPGWAARTRLFLQADWCSLRPRTRSCSPETWAALVTRCGPLPEALRLWLTELGGFPGVLDVDTIRPLSATPTFAQLSADDRRSFAHAVALNTQGTVFLPEPRQDDCLLVQENTLHQLPLWVFLASVLDESMDPSGSDFDPDDRDRRMMVDVWRLGTLPSGVGAPGWPERARRYLQIAQDRTVTPPAPADLDRAIARCGVLPPLLTDFLSELGEPCDCLRLDELRPLTDTPAYARLRPDLQDRYAQAIALDSTGLRLLDPAADFQVVRYHDDGKGNRHDLVNFLRTRVNWGLAIHGFSLPSSFNPEEVDRDPWGIRAAEMSAVERRRNERTLSQAKLKQWRPKNLFLLPTRMDMVQQRGARDWLEIDVDDLDRGEGDIAPESLTVAGEEWDLEALGPALEEHLLLRLWEIWRNLPTVEDWPLPEGQWWNDWWEPEKLYCGPGIVMVQYPRARTIWALRRFAWAADWQVADENAFCPPWAEPEPLEDREAELKDLEHDAHLPPYQHIGEAGWATEARRYFQRHHGSVLRPCSEEEIQAAEARCGRPLPEKLRMWLADLGQHRHRHVLEVDRLRPLDPAELPIDLPAQDRPPPGAISFHRNAWLHPDPPHTYCRWHLGQLHVESLEDFLSCLLNANKWVPKADREWLLQT